MSTWPTRRLLGVAEVVLGRQRSPEHDTGPHMIPYLRAANVQPGNIDLSDVKAMNFTPREQRTFALEPGDVLVTEGSGSLASVGAAAQWDGAHSDTICFQNTLLRLRARLGVSSRWLYWWAQHAFGSGLFAAVAGGASIYHLSAERVRGLAVPVPPLDEQRRIADFLDTETARLDALIDARHQQVTLLQEQAMATIAAVVSGTDTAGPRVATPWPWMPSLPATWTTGPVYGYYDVQLGKMLNPERASGPNRRPYLRNANVHWFEIDTGDLAEMSFEPQERLRYRVEPGELLVCEGGAGVAEAAVWPGEQPEIYFQKSLHRCRARTDLSVEWLMYWLRLAKACGVFDADGNLATIPHLTGEQLASYRIPIPRDGPLRVARIGDALDRISAAVRRLQASVILLAERRQTVITAAVTGQLDVATARGRAS